MKKNNLPDFSSHGYQVIKQLGCNYSGGRTTYLATDAQSQLVVLKQFQFASSTGWMGYKAVEREIQILRNLDHPRIPKYLDSWQANNGFCLVQEYKYADNLALPQSFSTEEIKTIAIALLEILAYLQKRHPPIIHRDIKPDNVLLDSEMNVYLVDFGFAKIHKDVAESSMTVGTLGFMPPEQLFHRSVSEASDLYGVGATLICLLTGIKSTNISNLMDTQFRIRFKHLVPNLEHRFILWLEKMVEPNIGDRFKDAQVALEALQKIQVFQSSTVETKKAAPAKNIFLNKSIAAIIVTGIITLSTITFATFSINSLQKINNSYSTVHKQNPQPKISRVSVYKTIPLEIFSTVITICSFILLYFEFRSILLSPNSNSPNLKFSILSPLTGILLITFIRLLFLELMTPILIFTYTLHVSSFGFNLLYAVLYNEIQKLKNLENEDY